MPHYQTGLFIGRFQPFHLGHLTALKQGLEIADRIILVIGSANQNFSWQNPLTVDERLKIIQTVLKQSQLDQQIKIGLTIDDIPNNLQWTDEIIKQIPPFQVVVGNNSLNTLLFSYRQFKQFHPKLTKRELYQGEIVRQHIVSGKPWRQLVPKVSLPLLEKYQLEQRLRLLHQE